MNTRSKCSGWKRLRDRKTIGLYERDGLGQILRDVAHVTRPALLRVDIPDEVAPVTRKVEHAPSCGT